MAVDLTALIGGGPEDEKRAIFYAIGCKAPPVNRLDVSDSLKRFCAELLPHSPFHDPRGKKIYIRKNNYPKLADIVHATLPKEEFSASQIVRCIEDGSYSHKDYLPRRKERCKTLFWIPGVLLEPDAIYKNGHKVVVGDEIYVKVYDKDKSKIKLVFRIDVIKDGNVIFAVPITSFLTDPKRAMQMVAGTPLYVRQ